MKQVRLEYPGPISPERLEYANSVFGWLQNASNAELPNLKPGHRMVLRQAFGNKKIRDIAKTVGRLEEDDKLIAQLLVSGFGSETVRYLAPDTDILSIMGRVGMQLSHDAEDADINDIFCLQTEEAYQSFQELQRGQIPELNILGAHRVNGMTDGGTIEEFVAAVKSLPSADREILRQLAAGINKQELIESFGEQQIFDSVSVLKKQLHGIRVKKARTATKAILNYPKTTRRLKKLETDVSWGSRVACTSEDDHLFIGRQGRSGGADPRARMLCDSCMVRLHCLNDALISEDINIVRGGMTLTERKTLLDLMEPAEAASVSEEEGVA
jgi:hypothetical protein